MKTTGGPWRAAAVARAFVWLLLPAVAAGTQLPPAIEADRHLVRAERAIEGQDYIGAKAAMDEILELRAEHDLEVPEQFFFRYAEVLERLGQYDEALEYVTEYLALAGQDGEYYREALELFNDAEKAAAAEEAARRRAEAAAEAAARRRAEVAAEVARRNAAVESQLAAGVFRDCDECPEMMPIAAGTFRMGCVSGRDCLYDEQPVHAVTIVRPFALSKYEVTFEEYERFTEATDRDRPDDEGWGRGRRPVIWVSWNDAQAYVSWLSSETGVRYRLPSESEWEYAARAGTATAYSWGNEIGVNRANCDGCGSRWDDEMTAPVGSFAANAWGLHDMHGNVWEWVEDCWHDSYAGAPGDGSAWTSGGDCGERGSRGGSWFSGPWFLRAAIRLSPDASYRDNDKGFRVARTLGAP